MFIAYSEPSSEKDSNARRMINTHVAASTSVRQLRSRKNANGCVARRPAEFNRALNWFHNPSRTKTAACPSEPEEPASVEERSAQHVPKELLLPSPVGAGRFYPIEGRGDNAQGPLLLPALSFYFDILIPHDAKVVGLGKRERDSYATDLSAWTVAHNDVLHSLAAFSLCIMYHTDRSKHTHQAILYHRQQLIKAVRERLSSQQVDDVLLHTLCIMISVDESLGFSEYRPVHLKGLQAVMQARETGNATSSSGCESLAAQSPLGMVVLVNKIMVEFHLKMNRGFHRDVTVLPRPSPAALSSYPKGLESSWPTNFPPGFANLAQSGTVTTRMLDLLADFASWFYAGMGMESAYRETWRYSDFEPANGVEKCISIALVSLADDLSAIGSAPCAVIFRQADQRAEIFLSFSYLWDLPSFEELVIWLATVIATPKKKSLLSKDVQRAVLKTSIRHGKVYHSTDQIDFLLRRFFYDESRVADWREAWESALAL